MVMMFRDLKQREVVFFFFFLRKALGFSGRVQSRKIAQEAPPPDPSSLHAAQKRSGFVFCCFFEDGGPAKTLRSWCTMEARRIDVFNLFESWNGTPEERLRLNPDRVKCKLTCLQMHKLRTEEPM